MLKFENVATPFDAFAGGVPDSVPPAGFVPIATLTTFIALVTVLPNVSWIATWKAGVIAAPATVLLGCMVNTSFAAVPGVIVNVLLVAGVRPLALAPSVYPAPALSMLTFENVATPLTAFTVAVPNSVPLLGFVPMASVMLFVAVVTVLPSESWIVT